MVRIGESTISRILVFHLRMLGIWLPEKFSTLYFVYSALLYIICSFTYVVCMCLNFLFLTTISDTTHSIYMTFTCVALLFKTTNFLWYNRDMKNNCKIINDFQLLNDDEVNFVRQRMRTYWNIWLSVYTMINATIVAAFVSAVISIPKQLPFRAYYPMDWQHNERNYWIVYTYQVVGMVVQANLNIVVEVFPGFLIYMVSVKMDILSKRLRRIGKNLKKSSVQHIDSSRAEQRKSIIDLMDCIKLHQHIANFIGQIEDNFSIAYFVQFCLSGIVICSVTYAMTTVEFQYCPTATNVFFFSNSFHNSHSILK